MPRQQGYDAYLAGVPCWQNPYIDGSMEADEWDWGWDNAQSDYAGMFV